MSKHKFILNDETKINQYGFRVSNAGLDLARFKANPVILDYHKTGNEAVIGRWENIQIEGPLLTAEAVFDDADPNAAKISGKVERGFLKGCSLGLNPFSMSNFIIAPDDVYDLVKSEVLEASIVAIPNNANAIKLYASTEESFKELEESEVSDILLMASDVSKFNLNNSMKKITLSIAAISALGLPGTSLEHDENVVNEKIINLKSELEKANQKIKGFEDLEKDKKATKKDEFIKLHAQSPDLYKSLVGSIPTKVNLAGQTVPTGDFGAIKSLDDFEKLDLTAQLEFKNSQPEAYKKLFS